HVLSVAAADPIRAGDRAALLNIAQQIVPADRVRYVAFADPAGRIIAGAQHGEGHLSSLLYDQGLKMPISSLDAPIQISDGVEIRVDVTYPVFQNGGPEQDDKTRPVVGYVRLGLSLQEATRRLALLNRRVVVIAFMIALLMVPLGFGIVQGIAHPLGALIAASRQWAAGRLEERVKLSRRDEVGDLGVAFNTM